MLAVVKGAGSKIGMQVELGHKAGPIVSFCYYHLHKRALNKTVLWLFVA